MMLTDLEIIKDSTEEGIRRQEFLEKFESYGYFFERRSIYHNLKKTWEAITSVTEGVSGRKIALGEFAVSNGRFLREGLRGIVVKIRPPFVDGGTSNIVGVLFEGPWDVAVPVSMKFRDLK